jgi:hypothetical protein
MQRVTFSATPSGSSAKPFSKSALSGTSVAAASSRNAQAHGRGLRAVGKTLRMGVAGAGRRQRLEAQALQIARAADVPRIGNDEAAGLVQLAEGLALVGN